MCLLGSPGPWVIPIHISGTVLAVYRSNSFHDHGRVLPYTPHMLMVIFGAGASFDSSVDFPPPASSTDVFTTSGTPPAPEDPREAWRPPLTNGLFLDASGRFGNIVETYPRLHGILTFLRRPQSGSVEQQLELYLDQASTDQERARQLLSVRYYLHDLFRMVSAEWLKLTNGVTNYATLIDQIRHLNTTGEPVCLVSFNYDLLLDRAVFSSGNTQPLERHFDTQLMFKLFKPHGSVDWARFVAGRKGMRYEEVTPYDAAQMQVPRLSPENIIEQVPDLSDQYVRANATDADQIYKFNSPIIPAIAIPVQTKTEDTFEWPDSHRAYFEQLLPQVTKILIIGWRGKEAHFLNLLGENLPHGGLTQITRLQVVGSDSAEVENISKQFLADIDRRVLKLPALHAHGFSGFVREEQVAFLFKD